MELLGNVYSLSVLAGLLYVVICYVDSNMNNKKKELSDHVKTFIVGTLITLGALSFRSNFGKQSGGSSITEAIYTGKPNF